MPNSTGTQLIEIGELLDLTSMQCKFKAKMKPGHVHSRNFMGFLTALKYFTPHCKINSLEVNSVSLFIVYARKCK